ncbi:hypothetical protein [Bradyrhizobium ottawaense]|uniref:hypothetical protein n=1 Tax=Bradyrhizobium ottawaense TaxID=931866 RepID=UPI000481EEFC|nr:hypothetical protein [Bradyrhizobium ottawaense]
MRLRKLIALYQSEPLSKWHGLAYATQKNHRNLLRQIDRRYGHVKLKKIKGRTLIKWHARGLEVSAARAFIKKIRVLKVPLENAMRAQPMRESNGHFAELRPVRGSEVSPLDALGLGDLVVLSEPDFLSQYLNILHCFKQSYQ